MPRMPRDGSSEGPSTIAPAASPKSTQVFRSVQSVSRLSSSAPMTSTRRAVPFRMNWSAMDMP